MNRRNFLLVIAIVILFVVTIVEAQTQYWYLLEGEDGYVICPTELHVNVLAPNAIYLTCDGSKIYMPSIER